MSSAAASMRVAAILLFALGLACNTRTLANERRCSVLSADECRADRTCVAVGGPGLEPYPPAIAEGKRCEAGCAKGWMPEECVWAPAPRGMDPSRIARGGRACTGPPRCELRRTNNGDYCFDPTPPCGGCRQVFAKCQSANLCNGVICP